MAEWSNAAVLKTVDLQGSGGSNPSLSAAQKKQPVGLLFLLGNLNFFNKGSWDGGGGDSDEIVQLDDDPLLVFPSNLQESSLHTDE